MGLYARYVLPWMLHLSMQHADIALWRERMVPRARGRVLEIGFGSGLNLPYYGEGVRRLTALEPSAGMVRLAGDRLAAARFPVEVVEAGAEKMPFPSWAFDTVISTWTLCSVADPVQVLAEVRRVLRPGGEFLFVEHGRAGQEGVARWQRRLNPVWRCCAGGCNLDRRIGDLVTGARLKIGHLNEGYLIHGPRVLTWHYVGHARPY